jgi:hypothetical protein
LSICVPINSIPAELQLVIILHPDPHLDPGDEVIVGIVLIAKKTAVFDEVTI